MKLALIAVAVLVGVVIVAFVLWRAQNPPVLVIGAEMADADEQERLHRQRHPGLRSPLPAGKYDDASLIDPQPNDLDRELAASCARYAQSSEAKRQQFRDAATMDDFYRLLHFARRAAVFALRERSETWVRNCLAAIATIDAARIDERDIPLSLSLVHHAAARLQLPVMKLFEDAASLAMPRTAELLRSFARGSASEKDIAESWGHREIQTSAGAGFVQSSFDPYRPTVDLERIGLEVRQVLLRDRYGEADLTVASSLPEIWFPKEGRARAKQILAKSVAGVSVLGTLRDGEHERAAVQSLHVFIMETASDADAAALEQLAASGPFFEPATFVLRHQRVFLLAAGRSFQEGVPSYETPEKIRRFEDGFRRALEAP